MQITYRVKGLHCAGCVRSLEKTLNQVDGIQNAAVNLALETVTFDSDKRPSLRKLNHITSPSGFRLFPKKDNDLKGMKQEEINTWQKRLVLQSVLGIPLLLYSMTVMAADIQIPVLFDILMQFSLASLIMIIGRQFYRTGVAALIRQEPNMDSLVALGTASAYVYSLLSSANILLNLDIPGFQSLYFESAGVILLFITFGRTLEARAKGKTVQALTELLSGTPSTGWVLRGDGWTEVPAEDIQVGDKVRIRPGEKIPVDGTVFDGETHIDESAITGESMPEKKRPGDPVLSATMNRDGSIIIKTQSVGKNTVYSKIIQMVEDAQATKAPIQALADRIASHFVPTVIILALAGSCTWFALAYAGLIEIQDPIAFSLNIFISVLIIACPCALGLATPTAVVVGTGLGAKMGIHFKSAESLQRMSEIDSIVFDKTGTLTTGRAEVTDISAAGDEKEFLELLHTMESRSEHHLAETITDFTSQMGYKEKKLEKFKSVSGFGVRGIIDDRLVLTGSMKFLERENVTIPEDARKQDEQYRNQSKTVTHLSQDAVWLGMAAVSDTIRIEAEQVVYNLQKRGLDIWLITGDNQQTAEMVGKTIGVDKIMSEVLPGEKAEKINALKQNGKVVAMVGDGINDAPALAVADVGISISSGTDVAIETSDIVLMHSDLTYVNSAFQLSRTVVRKIKQNLFWAFFYNVVGITIALGILYPATGLLLNPMMAGFAMAFSSVSVVSNTLLLKKNRRPKGRLQ